MESVLKAEAAGEAPGLELNGLQDFDAVVHAHERRVYRVLLGMVRDPDAAETLAQECFLRAYQRRTTYRGEASVGTWLVGIAVNLARDHARNRRVGFWKRLFGAQAVDVSESVTDHHTSVEGDLLAQEKLQAVWATAETLSPQQRAVFLLRFVEEMSLEEIAQATGLRVGTVKAHLFRALGAIRRRMKEWEKS